MKNLRALTALVGLLAANSGLQATSYVDITAVVGSSVCTGEEAECNQRITLMRGGGGGLINAIAGQRLNLDVKAVDVNDLGVISSNSKKDIELSVKDDAQTVYSFQPKDGTKRFVIFKSSVPGKGKAGSGRVLVTMYSQREGENPQEWTWRGAFSLDLSKLKPEDGKVVEQFTVTPNGRFEDIKGDKFAIS